MNTNELYTELRKTEIANHIMSFISKLNRLTDNKIVVISDRIKLVASCEHDTTPDTSLVLLNDNQRVIYLEKGFKNLPTHDKLLVIAASIKTHYQLTKGVITSFGEINHYELIKDNIYENRFFFNVDGKLIQDDIEEI
jgi:hypothetical protein